MKRVTDFICSRVRFDRNELSGAFGDIGTDLPLIIGMILASGVNGGGVFMVFGPMQVATRYSHARAASEGRSPPRRAPSGNDFATATLVALAAIGPPYGYLISMTAGITLHYVRKNVAASRAWSAPVGEIYKQRRPVPAYGG